MNAALAKRNMMMTSEFSNAFTSSIQTGFHFGHTWWETDDRSGNKPKKGFFSKKDFALISWWQDQQMTQFLVAMLNRSMGTLSFQNEDNRRI